MFPSERETNLDTEEQERLFETCDSLDGLDLARFELASILEDLSRQTGLPPGVGDKLIAIANRFNTRDKFSSEQKNEIRSAVQSLIKILEGGKKLSADGQQLVSEIKENRFLQPTKKDVGTLKGELCAAVAAMQNDETNQTTTGSASSAMSCSGGS